MYHGYIISVEKDSTLFRHANGVTRAVSTAALLENRTTDHASGMIDGLGLGALSGAGGGTVVTYVLMPQPSSAKNDFRLMGPILGAMFGVPAGAIAGLIIGSRSIYRFPQGQR